MSHRTAHRRYLKVFIPAMFIYIIGILGVTWAGDKWSLSAVVIGFLAIIPVLGIFTWMWAQWRYVKEVDEFIRALQTEAMMIGFMIITAIAMGWGLLELMADVPKIPVFYMGPGFYLFYGAAYAILAKRAGVKGMCL